MTQTPPEPSAASAKPVWTYTYELTPGRPSGELASVRKILDKVHAEAHADGRTWSGRLVAESVVTHVLIVTDDPQLDDAGIQLIEVELGRLAAVYHRTLPLIVEP